MEGVCAIKITMNGVRSEWKTVVGSFYMVRGDGFIHWLLIVSGIAYFAE
jgi:hypothetical protein